MTTPARPRERERFEWSDDDVVINGTEPPRTAEADPMPAPEPAPSSPPAKPTR